MLSVFENKQNFEILLKINNFYFDFDMKYFLKTYTLKELNNIDTKVIAKPNKGS